MNEENRRKDARQSEVEITDDDERVSKLLEARRFMQFGLAGEVIFWVVLLGTGPESKLMPLAMVGYFGAWFSTVLGVSRGSRAVGMDVGTRIGFYLLAFVLVLRLVPITYFLGRSKTAAGPSAEELRRQQTVEAARQRARERQQTRGQASATAAPAPSQPLEMPLSGYSLSGEPTSKGDLQKTPAQPMPAGSERRRRALERVSKALPRIRLVQPLSVPDGTPLKLRMAAKAGSPVLDTDAAILPVMRATSGVFGVMYMVDEGDRYSSLSQSELDAVDMPLDSLHRIALNNLKKLVQGDKPGLKFQPGLVLKMFMMGGDFESSLVLVDELWDVSVAHETSGDLYVCIATRDICIYCSAKTDQGLTEMRQIARDLEQRSPQNFITTQILRRSQGRWSIVGAGS